MDIIYLSESSRVNMADTWFEIAKLDHFWIQRRFQVFLKLTRDLTLTSMKAAEIGCGHGLVQRQFKDHTGNACDGFDLNSGALSNSVAPDQRRYVYDIYDRNIDLKETYDLILLFDVIEHVPDPISFIEACMFHLKANGYLAMNVPALRMLFSNYDKTVGHLRRYDLGDIEQLAEHAGLTVVQNTFWGFPLLPVAVARNCLVKFKKSELDVVKAGFKPLHPAVNRILATLSRWEAVPHRYPGTSVMAILQK